MEIGPAQCAGFIAQNETVLPPSRRSGASAFVSFGATSWRAA
jgi:hypothetical protein